jgi:hypothetical protein
MAENTGKLDINKLLADAKRQAAVNKAQREAAKLAASRAKSENAVQQRVKTMATQASDRAELLERTIQDDLTQIRMLNRSIVDAGGKVNTAQARDLKFYVDRYNTTLSEQQRLLKQSTDLSAGKYDVDASGKITPKGTASPTAGSASGPDAARQGMTPMSVTGATTSAAAAATADAAKASGVTGGTVAGGTPPVTPKPTGGTGGTGGKTPAQIAADKAAAAKKTADEKAAAAGKLTKEQEAKLGTYGSKFLIEYFKTAENGKYKTIYDKLVGFAKQNASGANVEAYLRDTTWYKDVNERTYSVIGASALANGITLDTATRDSYRDQILGKVKTADEIAYDIRLKSIQQYQLQTTKPDVAKQMLAGKNFYDAAADYINAYTTNLELASSQFKLEDANFQALFKSATSLGDFDKKVKRTEQYLSLPKVQQAINANVLMVKQKYRQYGLNLTGEAAANLGKNAYLGDTTTEQIDENLRQEAIKLFPAFRDRILNGESPLAIASPYIGAVSRILEVPEGSLDLEDPTIRKAMMGMTTTAGDKTTSTVKPLWEFEQELFKDSRWQYTANARQKLDGITLDVMGRFGVIG